MLSLALLHLVADSFARLSELGEYPWAALCTLAGLVLMLCIDAFGEDVANASQRAARGAKAGSDDDIELHQERHHGGGGHSHTAFLPSAQPFSKRALTAQLLEASVLVHSLIIGADLGVQQGGVWLLTLVLAVHQAAEGAALGAVVADCGPSLSTRHRLQLGAAFCLTTPAGVLPGLALSGSGQGMGGAAGVGSGVLDGLCGGMLLQMGTALLLEELAGAAETRERQTLFSLFAVGAAVMAVLAVWA